MPIKKRNMQTPMKSGDFFTDFRGDIVRLDAPLADVPDGWLVDVWNIERQDWDTKDRKLFDFELKQRIENPAKSVDWYEHQNALHEGDVFVTTQGDLVKLDRDVPGDATKWYAADWCGNGWAYFDGTVEPGDLAERADDPAQAAPKPNRGSVPGDEEPGR